MYYYRFDKNGKCNASANYEFQIDAGYIGIANEHYYDIDTIKLVNGKIEEITDTNGKDAVV
jgi:hypothetical protein